MSALSIAVELCQDVIMKRDTSISTIGAPTWQATNVNLVLSRNLEKSIRSDIKDLVGHFLTDHMMANAVLLPW